MMIIAPWYFLDADGWAEQSETLPARCPEEAVDNSKRPRRRVEEQEIMNPASHKRFGAGRFASGSPQAVLPGRQRAGDAE